MRCDPKQSVADPGAYSHTKNLAEQIGYVVVWPTYSAPVYVAKAFTSPQFLTAFFTLALLGGNTFAFYLSKSLEVARMALNKAKQIIPHMKFPAYCFVSSQIVGLGIRSHGRFANAKLMYAFDNARYPNPDA